MAKLVACQQKLVLAEVVQPPLHADDFVGIISLKVSIGWYPSGQVVYANGWLDHMQLDELFCNALPIKVC